MADETTPTGGVSAEQMQQMIADAIKPITDQVSGLQSTINEAAATAASEAVKPLNEQITALTEGLAKVPTVESLTETIQQQIEAREAATKESAEKTNARQQIIDKIVAEKLNGNADLGKLLTGDDEAALTQQAEVMAKTIGQFKPDFGGANKDGGQTPTESATETPLTNLTNASPGLAKFAQSIKLPSAPTAAPATAATSSQADVKTEAAKDGGDAK